MNDIVLLLTSTVNVKGMSFTALTDIEVRENHYIEAIEYYFHLTKEKIVIVENTGHDFSKRLDKSLTSSGRLEILSFDGNNFPKELGKGYGELEAISYAVNNSTFICDDTLLIKVTGRYKVSNINTFINDAYSNNDSLCHFLYFKGHRKAFSGLFIANKFFLKSILERHHHLMNDAKGIYFEHILSTAILEYSVSGQDYKMLKSFPRLLGISGTENKLHPTNSYSFWLVRNLIYKTLKANSLILNKLILRFFHG